MPQDVKLQPGFAVMLLVYKTQWELELKAGANPQDRITWRVSHPALPQARLEREVLVDKAAFYH